MRRASTRSHAPRDPAMGLSSARAPSSAAAGAQAPRPQLATAALAGVIAGLIAGVLIGQHAPASAAPASAHVALAAAPAACPAFPACAACACAACPAAEPCPQPACPEHQSAPAPPLVLVSPASFFQGGNAPGAGELPPLPEWRRSAAAPPAPSGGGGPMGVFQRLITWGFQPALILDVGANQGAWALEAWSAFGGAASPPPALLMFEGSERRAGTLAGVGFPYVISVVGAQARRVEFFDSEGGGTGNSVLREDTIHYEGVAPLQVVARTLDQLLAGAIEQGVAQQPPPRGVLLKLDVQVSGGGWVG